MKLGYIHHSKDELTKVMQVLKMTQESVALDELGIGRIRDAFADKMFPGISTLQKHVKYFSLMPQLYRKAIERRYNRLSEVKAEIVRLERIMTKNLYEGSAVKTGITGSETIGKNATSYVRYDPAYIYNSGLLTFGILRSTQLYEQIYSASKALLGEPKAYKTDEEDTADDADEQKGHYQFCSFPMVNYDFTRSCSLELTNEDRDFIVEHILQSEACKGTLLRYLIDNEDLTLADKFGDIKCDELPNDLARTQDNARRFADFIYMVHVRYNYIYSGYEDKEMLDEFNNLLQAYRKGDTHIEEVLSEIAIGDNGSFRFCKDVAECIANNDTHKNGGLDALIVNREKRVKGSRRKIGNPSYQYSRKNRIHYYRLTYRWETVRQFIKEIREGVSNG